MTVQEGIEMFELYLDDTSELSSAEELALWNRVFKKVCRNRPWEWLKTPFTGVTSVSVPYIALPDDFGFLVENGNSTDNAISTDGNGVAKFVLVGPSYRKYRIINFQDRRQYLNRDGYAYLDMVNNRLVFTKQPTAVEAVEYDYCAIPDDLDVNDDIPLPVAPEIVSYGMAVDGYIIQLFEKARSYAPENEIRYNECLQDLAYHNANLRAE